MWKNKILNFVITAILILSTLSFTTTNKAEGANGATLYVGGSGPGNYTGIQSAVDNANDGDTIYVYMGVYNETVVINRAVTLVGETRNGTVIVGNGIGDVVYIANNGVSMRNFTITNSGPMYSDSGIETGASDVHLSNLTIYGTNAGIYVYRTSDSRIIDCILYNNWGSNIVLLSSSNNRVKKCECFNTPYGIMVAGSENISITDCKVYLHDRSGIYFNGSHHSAIVETSVYQNGNGVNFFDSHYNTVSCCNIYGNDKGISLQENSPSDIYDCNLSNNIVGISLWNSGNNTLKNNTIRNSTYVCVNLTHSNNNNIMKNIFDSGSLGITLFWSKNNWIINNSISNNTWYGLLSLNWLTYSSDNNNIFHNSFINNDEHAHDEGRNNWDNSYPSGGNYWDDYKGIDGDSDGIGDTPYNVPGDINQDRYPLIYPYGSIINLNTSGVFLTIQDAIDDNDTLPGHTIFVKNGTYYEHVTINKAINLIGNDKNTTIIDNSGSGEVICVNTDWVNITGFTIQNDGNPNHNGIQCKWNHYIVSSCTIKNCYNGIIIGNKYGGESNESMVSDCTFSKNICDIFLFRTTNSTIINNELSKGIAIVGDGSIVEWITHIIENNTLSGKPVRYYKNAKNVMVPAYTGQVILANCTNFTIQHLNFINACIPIQMGYSSFNNVSENNMHDYVAGIYLESSDYNGICRNTIENGKFGMYILISDNNSIFENNIKNNIRGIDIYVSNNQVYHNNFINNSLSAYDDGANTWDNGYPSGGNYWSDYDGWDIYQGPNQDIPGGDRISDTPYNITGDSNQDRYPLMHPYSVSSNVYFQGIEPMYTTEYIEIAITIDPKEAIAGAQLDFIFDPDMLSIEWVAEGNVFSEYDTYFDQGVIDNINGTLKNVVSLITTPGGNTTNQGSVAIVAIRAKTTPGETPLNLTNVIGGRPNGTSIDVTIINTTVMIYHHDRWDVNWDDRVNILDLIIIGQWWGETGTPCWVSADVNCDGVVNILDMILVGQHWTR